MQRGESEAEQLLQQQPTEEADSVVQDDEAATTTTTVVDDTVVDDQQAFVSSPSAFPSSTFPSASPSSAVSPSPATPPAESPSALADSLPSSPPPLSWSSFPIAVDEQSQPSSSSAASSSAVTAGSAPKTASSSGSAPQSSGTLSKKQQKAEKRIAAAAAAKSQSGSTSTGPTPAHLRAVGHPAGKVFIGGLSWETTDEGMRSYFSKYGVVVDSVVIRDRSTERSRGFGFVVFTTPEAAIAACKPGIHRINGRDVEAKRAIPKEEMGTPTPTTPGFRSAKLFVAGIVNAHTDADLRRYFEQFGELVECQIIRNRQSGKTRGFGFVSYADDASLERVLFSSVHYICGNPVDVKISKPNAPASAPASGGSRYQSSFPQ
ncbi:MAG: hypothetical protein K2Z81_23355, partial [Cyanobacteria bacterium]|nr:hypothetical protein [Cyanobacteriota bacterium]